MPLLARYQAPCWRDSESCTGDRSLTPKSMLLGPSPSNRHRYHHQHRLSTDLPASKAWQLLLGLCRLHHRLLLCTLLLQLLLLRPPLLQELLLLFLVKPDEAIGALSNLLLTHKPSLCCWKGICCTLCIALLLLRLLAWRLRRCWQVQQALYL